MPPTLAEAIAYARVRMSDIPHETISAWHQTMSEQGWIFRNGNIVRNRAVRRMFRELDAPVHEHFRKLKQRRALHKLRKHPKLQATLKAIYRYRFLPRQKIFSALKIKGETYEKRLFRVRKILKIST